MVFKRKNIHFNIFRPKASSVKLNFFTRYISLFYLIYRNLQFNINYIHMALEADKTDKKRI